METGMRPGSQSYGAPYYLVTPASTAHVTVRAWAFADGARPDACGPEMWACAA
jgi:hypothetical protein